MSDELLTPEEEDAEYLRQNPEIEIGLWAEWVGAVCERKQIPKPTSTEWEALKARFYSGLAPVDSVTELNAMRERTSGMNEIDNHAEHCGNYLMNLCHDASTTAGWWHVLTTDEDLRHQVMAGSTLGRALVGQKLMLIVSEVAEAMEGHRKGLRDDKLPNRPMVEVELADVIIRVCDLAGALQLDLGGAIAEKLAYNAQRPDHKPAARAVAGGKAY